MKMSSNFKIILAWIIFACLLKEQYAEEETTRNVDQNMCNTTVRYPVEREMKYDYSYMEPYRAWCTSFPFRCTKFRQKTRTEVKTIIEYKNKTVYTCCDGYEQDEEECKPICDVECLNGNCTAPNICSCAEGWQGKNCSEECEEGKYGKNCFQNCLCENGATCDRINGICTCRTGFTGEYCESPCPGDSYGKNCENSCKCKNGAVCNKENGFCECKPGYHGKQCKSKCEVGTFGKDCENICKCKMENTNICSHIDGICFCKPGWRGLYCEKPCEDLKWGPSCLNSCECGMNASCHRVTGECRCPPGWDGQTCDQKCPVGYFSRDCKMRCPDCLHEPGTCHHETGWCNCPPGSTGPTCDLECPNGTYGNRCENICLCTNNSICDSTTGECRCFPGWTGEECQYPCPEGTYGKDCNFSCNCPHRFSCNRFDGNCDCDGLDDDPQCTDKSYLLLKEDGSTAYNATIVLVILTFSCIVFIVIFSAIFLVKRKSANHENAFSFFKSFRTFFPHGRKLKSPKKEDDEVNNPKNFENPVYEVMDQSLRSRTNDHSYDNPLAVTHDAYKLDLDFKIPDCDISSKENRRSPDNKDNRPISSITHVEKISIASTTAKYEKKDVDQTQLGSSSQSSPVYTEVDLTEHHFEFPSRRMN